MTNEIKITGTPIEQTEVKIRMAYIMRLKHYTDKVRETANGNDLKHKMAIVALLGYLEALEILSP